MVCPHIWVKLILGSLKLHAYFIFQPCHPFFCFLLLTFLIPYQNPIFQGCDKRNRRDMAKLRPSKQYLQRSSKNIFCIFSEGLWNINLLNLAVSKKVKRHMLKDIKKKPTCTFVKTVETFIWSALTSFVCERKNITGVCLSLKCETESQ
jgi:hypothetical protein